MDLNLPSAELESLHLEMEVKLSEPYLSEFRKKQIQRDMAHISFELYARKKYDGGDDVGAWEVS